MLIPVRCFSCGGVVADKYYEFTAQVQEGQDPKEVLDKLGLSRYCCRRMVLSQRGFLDEVIRFEEKGP